MTKVLITGASGFIGSHLLRYLCTINYEVYWYPGRNSCISTSFNNPKNKYLHTDLTKLDKFDHIYHIAGVLGKKGTPYLDYHRAHVELPQIIVNNLRPDQKLTYMSTAFVTCSDLLETNYVKTKILGEKIVKCHKNYHIVRPGLVYGPNDKHLLPIFQYINKLGRFFPIQGSGNNLICPTFVQDVIAVTVKGDGISLIAGHPIQMKHFLQQIATSLNKSKPFIHMLPVYKTDFFTKERVFCNGYLKTCLDAGLRMTVESYKKEGHL